VLALIDGVDVCRGDSPFPGEDASPSDRTRQVGLAAAP
jgi:hypothetical protein